MVNVSNSSIPVIIVNLIAFLLKKAGTNTVR